ncbi:glycoside hydrolase [Phaeosphaeriaceae sp. PMI808]|nr:glycoside hydrolase [Phaeosphaeriaceae sp. PMI808]
MKYPILYLVTVILSQQINAHYVFNRLIINNTISREFQYVRDVTGNAGTRESLWYKAFPIFGPENANVTCGRGAFPIANSATIETATILAGDEIGFMVSGPFFVGDTQPYIYHEGPGQIFLSKLPKEIQTLNEYDGSGDFFKIGYAGPKSTTEWSLKEKLAMNVTIPKTTPPGKYLLRIEQFLPSSQRGQSQWFVNCAHVEIVGQGGGIPGPFTRFPNAYSEDDPGVWFPLLGYNGTSSEICGSDLGIEADTYPFYKYN